MGLNIYKQSLLLFTNASEHIMIKSEAREVFLHYKTYTVRQNKRNSKEPLHCGHLQTTDTARSSKAVRYMEAPLYLTTINNDFQLAKRTISNPQPGLTPRTVLRAVGSGKIETSDNIIPCKIACV